MASSNNTTDSIKNYCDLSDAVNRKLKKMLGNIFLYNVKEYKIIDFKIDEDTLMLATDKGIIQIENNENILHELKEFLPVEDEPTSITPKDFCIIPDKKYMGELKDIILENIKNVQKDKSYVAQANAINKSINTMISMANLELSYLKNMKR